MPSPARTMAKAVVMKLKKEQRPPPVIQAVAPPISRGKVEREMAEHEENVTKSQPQPTRDRITLKMQPDGTLQPEKETGEEIIIASARDARMRTKDQHQRSGTNDLIIAEDRESSEDA